MDCRLIWTERAVNDLADVVRHIARDDPTAAARIGRGIYERAQILVRFPESGSRLPERDDPAYRKLIYKSWKLVYFLDRERHVVTLLRVWHAARGEVEL